MNPHGAPLSTADAVAYIEAEIAKGRTSFGGCPTPQARGGRRRDAMEMMYATPIGGKGNTYG